MEADGHPGLVALGLGPRAGMHPASRLSLRRVFLHAVYMLVSVCHPSGVPADTPTAGPLSYCWNLCGLPRPRAFCILPTPGRALALGEGSCSHRAPMGSAIHPSVCVDLQMPQSARSTSLPDGAQGGGGHHMGCGSQGLGGGGLCVKEGARF